MQFQKLSPYFFAFTLVLSACATSSETPGDTTGDTSAEDTTTQDTTGDNTSGSGGTTNPGDAADAADATDPANPVECPEAATFMDLSAYAGAAGAAYDDPQVSATCTETTMTVVSNGIPNYTFVQITPNALGSQNYEFLIPRNPAVADATSEIALLGPIGVAVNGIPLYGPNEAAQPDPYGDPVYNDILDFCLGHTAPQGVYHYHATLVQCLSDLGVDNEPDTNVPSPIIGWAFDGFPIYGPLGCTDADCTEVVEFQSGWNQIGDPTTYAWDNHEFVARPGDATYLDECNGRIGPEGDYRYHATATFPYILGCFSGTEGGDGGGDGPGGNGGGPPLCESDADCVDACPQAELGCSCIETPNGDSRCIANCESDDDCPGNLTCNLDGGFCVPGGMGQP
jgi:hypothetical protein